jgi:hypothetical protein
MLTKIDDSNFIDIDDIVYFNFEKNDNATILFKNSTVFIYVEVDYANKIRELLNIKYLNELAQDQCFVKISKNG